MSERPVIPPHSFSGGIEFVEDVWTVGAVSSDRSPSFLKLWRSKRHVEVFLIFLSAPSVCCGFVSCIRCSSFVVLFFLYLYTLNTACTQCAVDFSDARGSSTNTSLLGVHFFFLTVNCSATIACPQTLPSHDSRAHRELYYLMCTFISNLCCVPRKKKPCFWLSCSAYYRDKIVYFFYVFRLCYICAVSYSWDVDRCPDTLVRKPTSECLL